MINHSHIKIVYDHNDGSYRAETLDATHTLAVMVMYYGNGDWRIYSPTEMSVIATVPCADRDLALFKLAEFAQRAYDRLIVEAEQMARVG